jgi:hypothetical protein
MPATLGTPVEVPIEPTGGLTAVAANTTATFALPATTFETNIVSSPVLQPGTYLVIVGLNVLNGATAGQVELTLTTGSATATMTGIITTGQNIVASGEASLLMAVLAVVTAAGTLQINGQATQNMTVEFTSQNSYPGVTGWTIVRMA